MTYSSPISSRLLSAALNAFPALFASGLTSKYAIGRGPCGRTQLISLLGVWQICVCLGTQFSSGSTFCFPRFCFWFYKKSLPKAIDSKNVQSLQLNPHPLPVATFSCSTEKLHQNTACEHQYILVKNNTILYRMGISVFWLSRLSCHEPSPIHFVFLLISGDVRG